MTNKQATSYVPLTYAQYLEIISGDKSLGPSETAEAAHRLGYDLAMRQRQEEAARAVPNAGWIIGNGKNPPDEKFRSMHLGNPVWVERDKAMRFSRRNDAELFAAEDEDAWQILPVTGSEDCCSHRQGE